MWIKICGLCNSHDVRQIARLDGVSAIGLNRYKPSPRYLTRKRAAEFSRLIRRINPNISVVALYVNAPVDVIFSDADEFAPDIIQLHGDESPEYVRRLRTQRASIIKAFRIEPDFDFSKLKDYEVWRYLLDAYHPEKYGGTGEVAPWDKIAAEQGETEIILAGGLTPDNVATAIKTVRPWGVDVAGGVEKKGRKQIDQVQKFISEAKIAGGA